MTKLFVQAQNSLTSALRRDRGATAVEYGLIVAVIAGGLILVLPALRNAIETAFTNVTNAM